MYGWVSDKHAMLGRQKTRPIPSANGAARDCEGRSIDRVYYTNHVVIKFFANNTYIKFICYIFIFSIVFSYKLMHIINSFNIKSKSEKEPWQKHSIFIILQISL